MKPERWQQVEELYHAALERPAASRADFLRSACGDDEELCREVESLLGFKSQAENFIEKPALEIAAKAVAEDHAESVVGQQIGNYKILTLLGQGGMGEVYLAQDTKLGRKVAIKFLPEYLAADERARKRLVKEAQAAAQLEHPNICAIHEVSEEDGRSFIVMQYVEGETLDERMKRKPLELSESLSIATEIADALAEAHAHGIIHRDIKPSNIMITPRGKVKVLDFGLAKVMSGDGVVDTEAETAMLLTKTGVVMGTAPYMSPEQLRAEPLDGRSDIFSYGTVLYEIISGQAPFKAKSLAELTSVILMRDPPPLRDHSGVMPAGLEPLILKCLEKEPARRYQTMVELLVDLDRVSREWESGNVVAPINDAPTVRMDTAVSKRRVDWRRLVKSRVALVFIVLVMLALALIGYMRFFRSQTIGNKSIGKYESSPAYDYYLRGKVNAGSENRESNENAIKLLEQAVKADPNFAPAWADLARAYGIESFFFAPEADKKKLNEDAKVAVEKALALNPDLAEGHFVRGTLLWSHDNRFPHEQAIQSFKRAIALDPNLDEAHHQLGVVYFHIGLLDKAWDEVEKALAINPANTLARFRLGTIKRHQAKYEEALAIFKTVPPEAHPAILNRAMAEVLFELGRTQEASDIVEDYLKTYPTDQGGNVTSVKAMLLAKAGKELEAEEMIQRAVEIGKGYQHFHHTAYNIASAYAFMNKTEVAIKWLQNAADDGFPCYPLFENDAHLDSLRKDERFIAFMAKLKLQWEHYQATL
jgi:serine/threonine-protein kinase